MPVITSNAISRMVHDADTTKKPALRLSSLIYEEINAKLRFHLEDVMRVVVLFTEESKHRTIMKKYVYPVLDYIPIKSCRSGKKLEPDEDDSCFYFPKESFQNIVREITYDLNINLRFSTEALVLLQMNAEHYVSLLAKNAIAVMRNDPKRHTLFPKDLQTADRQLCKRKNTGTVGTVGTVGTIVSFDRCIEKALSQIFKKTHHTTPSAGRQLSIILNAVAQTIVKVADEMSRINDRKTLSTRSILYATRVVLPGKLAKHAVSEGKTNKDKLVFSVSVVESLVKSFTCLTITRESCLVLTAVLEYLTYELLDLSVSAADATTITSKHLARAIQNDEELFELMSRLHIV